MPPPAVDGLWNGYIALRHEQLRHDRRRPILDSRGSLFDGPRNFQESYGAWPQIQLHTFEWPPETEGVTQNFPQRRAGRGPDRPACRAGRPAEAGCRTSARAPARKFLLSPPRSARTPRIACWICFAPAAFRRRFFDSFAGNFLAGPLNLGITVSAAVSGLEVGRAGRWEILTEGAIVRGGSRRGRNAGRRRRRRRDPAKNTQGAVGISASVRPGGARILRGGTLRSDCRP